MHTTHLLNDKEPHNFEFWYPLNGQSDASDFAFSPIDQSGLKNNKLGPPDWPLNFRTPAAGVWDPCHPLPLRTACLLSDD